MGVFRCFVSLSGMIESILAIFHSLGMITFTMVLGSGAMCLGCIVMMLGGFKVCIFWHIHSPCTRTRTRISILSCTIHYYTSTASVGERALTFAEDEAALNSLVIDEFKKPPWLPCFPMVTVTRRSWPSSKSAEILMF